MFEINNLKIPEVRINKIYQQTHELIREFSSFIGKLLEQNTGYSSLEAIDVAKNYFCDRLKMCDTTFKRQKQAENCSNYVKPQEFVVGTHFEMKRIKGDNKSVPELLPSKGHYIPITETLRSLFKNDNTFRDLYDKFNGSHSKDRDHVCESGIYRGFCCGSVFKNNKLFQDYPDSIQIRLATDDFTIANPLGPAASIHSLTAVYFSIQNLPTELLSKIDNIYIVALVHADDIKTKETDYNDIWRMIVRDIGYLEEFGIEIENGHQMRATVSCLCSDNLGANSSLGLSGGFNANFFCRICKLSKNQCQTQCKEDIGQYRTMDDYQKQLAVIENSTKINLTESCGVKRYCVLNDLQHFKIFVNFSVDIMHDLNEGVIPFLLQHFFTLLFSSKILTENSLQEKCQYYDYGTLQSKSVPSIVSLTKANMNQTASQMLCLFRHIPFILFEFRNHHKLQDAWKCIQTLLKIVQIAYSSEIMENDIKLLEKSICSHLKLVQKVFGVNLIPKHHFLTHYGTLIRLMGPLVLMSTIRFESKHQHLKKLIATSNNTINVTKSITQRHQKQLAFKNDTYSSKIEHGKKLKKKLTEFELSFISSNSTTSQEIFTVDSFTLNCYEYKKGLLIIFEHKFFQIEGLYIINEKEYILCKQWDCVGFNEFLNSIQITTQESNEKKLICITELKQKQLFECKCIDQKKFIIVDTLFLKTFYNFC